MATKAKRDLYEDATRTRVVPGGHSDAKFLIAREGHEIPARLAQRHGIVDGGPPETNDEPLTPDLSTPRNNVAPVGRARTK